MLSIIAEFFNGVNPRILGEVVADKVALEKTQKFRKQSEDEMKKRSIQLD